MFSNVPLEVPTVGDLTRKFGFGDLKPMNLLFSMMTWLAPLGLLLVWQWSLWREHQTKVQFTDWLRADPFIGGLVLAQALIFLLPLGLWLILTLFIFATAFSLLRNNQQRVEWGQRKGIRALALVFLISVHLVAGFLPASQPSAEVVWGPPIIEGSENTPAWPASEQKVWVFTDGAIVVETSMVTPGVLNPWLASWGVNEYSQMSGAKEARFQEAVALMDDWTGSNAFSLSPIHDGVMHDYDGQKLLFTHDDVMLDLLGLHPSGEMITVWKPTWGGEMHLLTIIKVGPDPFLGNPGAQSYVVDWLNSN